ncbi:hypothetical protein KMZ29_24260 [Bradyrhizobium sediminis]|uniref:Uncharacterized protein n=1 Tax=Bradyrhizobium sediminis TaxID=2840469 RepID=A0A975RLU0_9BRAD|nr:hypothetical protein KMZ29_24260 [Bradyrhizobium sediminis]
MKQLAGDPQHAFPGHGQMKPERSMRSLVSTRSGAHAVTSIDVDMFHRTINLLQYWRPHLGGAMQWDARERLPI